MQFGNRKQRDLEEEHRPEVIRQRMSKNGKSALGDSVLGGVDGIITTFAVVAGSTGGRLSTQVIVVLGVASLFADGFSMAVSNFLSTSSKREEVKRAREDEAWQIGKYPKGERQEIREIFARKGFGGQTLDQIEEVISRNHGVWVDTMIEDELNLEKHPGNPWTAATATFIAFLVFGFVPLVPYVFSMPEPLAFNVSAGLSGVAFIVLGVIKGLRLGRSPARSGLQTFLIGAFAAVLAYSIGVLLRSLFGVTTGGG